MIAQRTLHKVRVPDAAGREVAHSPELVSELFDVELDRLLRETPKNGDASSAASFRKAREQSEGMILGVLQEQGAPIK
jgi:hypothetical protein